MHSSVLVCRSCGLKVDVDDGAAVEDVHVIFRGLCSACQRAPTRASASTAIAALRPLSAITLPPGWVAAPQK